MTLTDLLKQIRQLYISQLSRTAAQADFYIEPVLRNRDGFAVYEGSLATPYRCDLVNKVTFKTERVDATVCVRFDAVSCIIGNIRLQMSQFSWDMLTLVIDGISKAAAEQVMRNWFLHWFDENDSNVANAEGLYEVVHYISDSLSVGTAVRFDVDLGSAPADAVAALIDELCDQGASELKLC
jgi:hypothetical protein